MFDLESNLFIVLKDQPFQTLEMMDHYKKWEQQHKHLFFFKFWNVLLALDYLSIINCPYLKGNIYYLCFPMSLYICDMDSSKS